MKHMLATITCLLALTACTTRDTRLYGRWQSDLEKTMEYNKEHAQLTDQQIGVFEQMFGNLELEYRPDGILLGSQDAYSLTKGTNTFSFEASKWEAQYEVLGKDDDSVAILAPALFDDEEISTLHFDGSDSYWIYIGENDLFGLNMREYFTRIK